MNTVTLTGMRELWADVIRKEETMTAREMALASHNLNGKGNIATLKDGRKFYWNETREVWVR